MAPAAGRHGVPYERQWQRQLQRRPRPFDSALPNLRMNRAVARFTSSGRKGAGVSEAPIGRLAFPGEANAPTSRWPLEIQRRRQFQLRAQQAAPLRGKLQVPL